MTAPIALFAFNRPAHLAHTIALLRANPLASASDLWVFCDGPRRASDEPAVREVRKVAAGITGFASVHLVEREVNAGLAASITLGVKQLCDASGRAIVVEDDLAVAPGFLDYMNRALDRYADEPRVMQVCGYMFPVEHPERLPECFFLHQTTSWGWATWGRAWQHLQSDPGGLLAALEASGRIRSFDLHGAYGYSGLLRAQARGQVDSWAVLWYASVFLKEGLCLWPRRSLVHNEGFDGSGTHGDRQGVAAMPLWENSPVELPTGMSADPDAQHQIERYLRRQRGSFPARVVARLRSLIRAHAQG